MSVNFKRLYKDNYCDPYCSYLDYVNGQYSCSCHIDLDRHPELLIVGNWPLREKEGKIFRAYHCLYPFGFKMSLKKKLMNNDNQT